MVADKLHEDLHDALNMYVARANEAWPGHDFKVPTLKWIRGQTAGQAWYPGWEIRMNSVLLVENPQEMIHNTLPHELAHLIDHVLHPENFESRGFQLTSRGYRRGKRTVHGPTWKRIMRTLGADPTRTHNMDTTNAQTRTKSVYVWRCPICGRTETVGPKIHRQMKNRVSAGMNSGRWWKACKREGHTGFLEYVGIRRPEEKKDHNVLRVAAQVARKSAPKSTAPAPAPVRTPAPVVTAKSGYPSKKAHCIAIFRCHIGKSRADILNRFINEAGCTKAGASTYYATIKKEIG